MQQDLTYPVGTMSDEDLIRKAQGGDMAAFEQLVFRHDKGVLSLAARYVTSSDDAKDIYQEVFLRVYRNIKNFRFRGEFSAWLYRITVNVCLTHRSSSRNNSHARRITSDADDDRDSEGEIADPELLPDTRAVQNDIGRHLEEAVALLAPKQRMVFTLRHIDGYALKDIAAMMTCTEGTVKRYLFDATRKLRISLKDFT